MAGCLGDSLGYQPARRPSGTVGPNDDQLSGNRYRPAFTGTVRLG